ncbi:unnamed protein product [Rhizophagus irregularis]|nr:unnamed protein product [Rhizophagus irregularis]
MYGKCSKMDLIINPGSASDSCHGSFPSRYSGTYSFEKKRLKFPDDPRGIRLCNYLNFTLFTFNKIRILIQYLVAKIGSFFNFLPYQCKISS